MSIYLDPRTNDPYIDENGQLVTLTDDVQEMMQAFRVWMDTGIGMDILDPQFGFNLRDVIGAPWNRTFGFRKSLEVQFQRCVNQIPEFIKSIIIRTMTYSNKSLTIELLLRSPMGHVQDATVRIDEYNG